MSLWWVRRGDQTFGPVDEAALVNALREGRIQPGDLACREGGQEWLLVSSVPGVAEVFAPKRSQPPLQGQDPWREAAWMIGNMDGEIIEGPVSLEDVKALIARGTLTGGELIARVGSSAWQQIPDVMAEYGRAISNRPAAAPPMRTTIPPVPMPTGHPSTPPPRPSPTQSQSQPQLQSHLQSQPMHSTQTAPVSMPGMHATQTAEIVPAFLAPPPIAIPPAQALPSHAVPPETSSAQVPRPQPPRPNVGGPPRAAPRPFATTQTAARPPSAPTAPAPAVAPSSPPPPASPVGAQPASGDGWYFSRGGVPVGPLTHDQLRASMIAGEVQADTPVCRVDEWVWKPFSAFPELARRSAPPPLPPRNRTR